MSPKQVRQAREAAGMNRTEFAAACGVSERSVYRWEAGEKKPSQLAVKAMKALMAKTDAMAVKR